MAMKTTEVQQFVKETVAKQIGINDIGTEIGRYKYAVPVATPEDGTVYATITITCTKWKGTEKTEPFVLEDAVASYRADEAEKAERAEERKAEREAKAKAKAEKNAKTED